MKMKNRAVCMFGGSWSGDNKVFFEAAWRFGHLTAQLGWTLVYGGGGNGMMGQAARAALGGGGRVVGVVPKALRHLEGSLNEGEEIMFTPTLGERKERMIAMSDAFVILPGGIGTFDEFFEVLTAAQLGFHHKPIILVDVEAYFSPLLALLDHGISRRFAPHSIFQYISIVKTPEAAVKALTPTPFGG
jgi:uncharacterized protein (TIGR00730 family)